ncbi:hypothetical protein AVW09_11055 [Microbacterium sp. T32]|nr:hypothetical protein AVW09_11055 [Microbacterium sp. T32]
MVTMARLTLSDEPFIAFPSLSALADSSVSFTQRPALAATSDPPFAAAERRCRLMFSYCSGDIGIGGQQ